MSTTYVLKNLIDTEINYSINELSLLKQRIKLLRKARDYLDSVADVKPQSDVSTIKTEAHEALAEVKERWIYLCAKDFDEYFWLEFIVKTPRTESQILTLALSILDDSKLVEHKQAFLKHLRSSLSKMLAKNMIKEVKSGKSRSFYIVDRNSAYQLVANHSSTVIEFPHTKTQ